VDRDPRICVRDCSCFWGSPSNDGSFSKTSERLGRGSEDNDSPTSPLLASACSHRLRLFDNRFRDVRGVARKFRRSSAAVATSRED
jgi:hypothetical protein